MGRNRKGIWRYERWLPHVSADNQVSMGEGNTPLVKSRRIAQELGLSALYFKLEGTNPTGSYKDRISALGVSWALEHRKAGCIGTSSGNAGASAAAYAASAGLSYTLFVLEHIVEAKLMQAMLHDAQIYRVKGFGESAEIGDKVFRFIEKQGKARRLEVMITAFRYNPIAMEAVKTISYELLDELGANAQFAVFVPVGGGGLFTGIWKGFKELQEQGRIARLPLLAAVQSAGCSNIVKAWRNGESQPLPGDSTSQISGLQVPNPPDGQRVLQALQSDEGIGISVADEETWRWQEKLAAWEGIWCEPAAAVAVSGLKQALDEGKLPKGASAVCILTGAGYKDMDRARSFIHKQPQSPLVDIDDLPADANF